MENKKKYKITFDEFLNGRWMHDYFSNNGAGFDYNDALYIYNDLKRRGMDDVPIRNVQIEEMK